MRHTLKHWPTLAICLCAALALLAGCGRGAGQGRFSAAELVRNNLDLIYLNKYEESYLEQVALTSDEAEAQYERGIALETEYFADYFDIDLEQCDGAIQAQIAELYRQIYSNCKYEVADKAEQENGVYMVDVTIYPIDLIRTVRDEDISGYVTEWQSRGEAGEFIGATDTEFESAWAQGIIDLVYARLGSIGYEDPQTFTVQVGRSSETGRYAIAQSDFKTIDSWMIAY